MNNLDEKTVFIEYARLLRRAFKNPLTEEYRDEVIAFEYQHEELLKDFWLRWRNPGSTL
jgi:hypothetical protein